ncbi:ABC transporter substrate-binding protein [Bombella sp. TMW 2.2559]|uniref:ABC transporter substrate-binding protein n=1 Tax=Bombella dulcis TaxID=2967339 RepID=A0ABT3WCK1_9PROT|nr:ABC transporter substrate-binding protein [Bombella dulcis]MCX5616791.1 ABC transporter substrate-binding protein [Bombella dulcis]
MMLRQLTRRTILGAASLFALVPTLAFAAPSSDEAKAFVGRFGSRLVTVLNSNVPLAKKRDALLPLLRENVDVQGIGRYCLGRYWRVATPEQQKLYLELFQDVLLNAVTARMGEYQNISFRLVESVPSPAGQKVTLQISRPHQPDVLMTAVIDGEPPKVVDLYGEGASMRMTQRSDYTTYLTRHGGQVQTLINALKHQLGRD